ncbi:MAG TPA: AI-2E family transporter [Opitutaceae bacterium]|jgi:predicted PurR-regulated permease PerM
MPTEREEASGESLDHLVTSLSTETSAAADFPAPIFENHAPTANRVQLGILTLALAAFLYFARPVILPLFLACLAATALRPFMRGLARLGLRPAFSGAVVCAALMAVVGLGFFELARPAIRWMDEAPSHLSEMRGKFQQRFPNAARFGHAIDSLSDVGVASVARAHEEQPVQTVEIKDRRGANSILNWTGTVVAGLGEVFVLVYLLLASGDLFMHKLVRVMPTLRDKKRAVEITHEVQTNLSNYLFSVSVINICLGTIGAAGFHFLGVPRAAMWGMLAAVLNFVPYFGPILVVLLLAVVGMLSFDSVPQWVLPACWYLVLHLLESNFVTPILLGRRFTLNPVAIFVSLMFWLWLWGIPGALLAVPILVSVKAICDRVPNATYISELIGS